MTYIALLRGINVGGNKPIRMSQLAELCESLGFTNIRTYVQSGNVIFDAREAIPEDIAGKLEKALQRRFGFEVKVFVRTPRELSDIIAGNPLIRKRGIDRKKLHVTFLLTRTPLKTTAGLDVLKAANEMVVLKVEHIYLYCPNGYGKSKLSNPNIERKLRVVATTRNWNTVCALRDLAEGLQKGSTDE